ncbi:hypothetical protein R3P38DRAFT_3547667 [Favolaschia claudopus]|uniref:Ubiquitin-like protease family profile domain-containing protein n=1 Tax=Favolaschia claudopus TaxID=2862362 RepID=A0AAW0E4D9_9AGAR
MEPIIVDCASDDETIEQWNPAVWIGQGKRYENVPAYVDSARRRVLTLPSNAAAMLPPTTLPISQFLLYNLPPVSQINDAVDLETTYTFEDPTPDLEGLLRFLAIPSRRLVNQLVDGFGQAWFDGRKSIHTTLNPEIAYPFWILTFWRDMLDATEAKARWLRAERWLHLTGKTREETELKLQVRGIWSVVGWRHELECFAGLPVDSLANLLADDMLDSRVIDALLALLSLRARLTGDETLIIGTVFAQFIRLLPPIIDGLPCGPIIKSVGSQRYLAKYGEWFQANGRRRLYNVLYRDPQHWTAVRVDFETCQVQYGDGLKWQRPSDFFEGLRCWIDQYHESDFCVTDDLVCAEQTDGFNCGIIAVNTIAHNEFGDVLWTQDCAKAMRMKAFCDIMQHALSIETSASVPCAVQTDDIGDNVLAVDLDFNDALLSVHGKATVAAESCDSSSKVNTTPTSGESEVVELQVGKTLPPTVLEVEPIAAADPELEDVPMDKFEPEKSSKVLCGAKRERDEVEEVVERKRKVAKTSADPAPVARHPLFSSNASRPRSLSPNSSPPRSKKTAKNSKKHPSNDSSSSFVGASRSATTARSLRQQVKDGTFRPSAKKTRTFQENCRAVDPECSFEPTCSKVQCSICKVWKPMKEPYNTSRFKEHAATLCEPPPEPKTPNAITNFFTKTSGSKPKPLKPRPQLVSVPCPGLTARYDESVGRYLENSLAMGGGARSLDYYSREIFQKSYVDLSDPQKQQVKTAQIHGRSWTNNTSVGVMATFSTKCLKRVDVDVEKSSAPPPCHECILVFSLRPYQAALRKEPPKQENLKFIPHVHRPNQHAALLCARVQGLEGLLAENNEHSLERRWVQHLLSGKFKDDKVFLGLVELKVMGLEREIKGLGKQNFKYNEDLDAFFGLVHTTSPRAYRELAKHFPIRSERSIEHKISTSPRFPLGITAETYMSVGKYCEDYGYPRGAPLSLAVDDTKLFAALRPLYDGVKKKWFIVGASSGPIEVPDVESLHATLDRLEKNPPTLATKLRLWTLQIPIPRVPPLVLAVMAIDSNVKASQLGEWQIALMRGLALHGFRIIASGGDGAAVERECQRRLTGASKRIEFKIKHPDPECPDIVVEIWELDGNVFVIFQDAKHLRKTIRNNAGAGARGLVLGNYLVYYEQMFTLAIQPDSPMYARDWKNRDRMDDNAAARLTSADTLQQAAQDPAKHMGLVAYLFVFGDLVDAYQSRTISHHERAKIAIRAQLFLRTWRTYLAKAGCSEARHFISKEAFDICGILINGILGLIVIHRDYLGDKTCPLLPWFIASEPNEHSFSGLRLFSKDFALHEAICILPKIRAQMQSAVLARLTATDFKKQASGYAHTYFTKDDVDFSLLAQYPSDVELGIAYEIAMEENNCLWSLLGIHPHEIANAPDPKVGLRTQPAPDPAHEAFYLDGDTAEDAQDVVRSAAEQLQKIVDSLKSVANISRAGDNELDACVMASVTLAMEELATIEDLPVSNPERFAEIQTEIAQVMSTQPTALINLLEGIASTALAQCPKDSPPSSRPLTDISSTDLASLVQIRREHQTREERMGVRTYKGSGTYKNPKTGEEKPLTERQLLAQKMQAIIGRDQEKGSSTGLNRTVRWTGSATKTGNAANAELAATGRAKETVKRRRNVFKALKCISRVAEAGVDSSSPLEAGLYGFVMVGSEIFLARVVTMYSKNGGKAGAHSWVPKSECIGALSYILVQLHQHSYRRQFKYHDRNYRDLGTLRFTHLPSNSFLFLLPQGDSKNAEPITEFRDHLEIGRKAYTIFEELDAERASLAKAVASLNTVRRKGKPNVNVVEIEEEEAEDEED